ncbi:MAG TPA: ATP-binding cassette domain-containing protein, partial [Phycisphaerales bacterium]|nr:ATP-binding cassette domain-containing protein [Phycisphaerales bacterium]
YKRLHDEVTDTFVRKQTPSRTTLHGEYAQQDRIAYIERGSLSLGDEREVRFPELTIAPRDQIGIIGQNGIGKSTLIRHLVEHIAVPRDRLVYIPQEIDSGRAHRILSAVREMPKAMRGEAFGYVACLGSDVRRLLETEMPSPGELRKLTLALGMIKTPYLVVMDEPTNHLDLPSIKALEKTLSACNCALILVSHDLRFLRKLVTAIWHLTPVNTDDTPGSGELHIGPLESFLQHKNRGSGSLSAPE